MFNKRNYDGDGAMENLYEYLSQYMFQVIVFAGLVAAALLVSSYILKKFGKSETFALSNSVLRKCRQPLQWMIILFSFNLFITLAKFPQDIEKAAKQLVAILLIVVISWLIIRLTSVIEEVVLARFDVGRKDNLKARKVHTQLKVTRRIILVIVFIVALGTILMTFERVRQLGTTILASAGILSIVVGMAAQKTIATFIAGLQIAFTQPIRIDDVVIVENEWGWIEEINLTYVVVRIWDLRRLIVPITYFIERPFQNWTRTSADLLGSVFVYADYNAPIDDIRDQLRIILEGSEYWDKKCCVLQVTNTTEKTIELRALMSACDGPTAWNLRCEVREKLVKFINENHSDKLPKLRVEMEKQTLA